MSGAKIKLSVECTKVTVNVKFHLFRAHTCQIFEPAILSDCQILELYLTIQGYIQIVMKLIGNHTFMFY